MLKRIKKLWDISNAPKERIDSLYEDIKENERLMGDGKAVFLGDATEKELEEFEKEESGMKGWYDRLKNL